MSTSFRSRRTRWSWPCGPKGFLSYQGGSAVTCRWTRYLDGATTVLPSDGKYAYAPESDIVPEIVGNGRFTMHDMSTGTALELDISPLGDGYAIAGYAGADILAKKANATGGHDLHVIGKRAGALVDDTVTGLPTDAVIADVTVDGPATAVVRYSSIVDGVRRSRAAVVDIASHAVVEEYAVPAAWTGRHRSVGHPYRLGRADHRLHRDGGGDPSEDRQDRTA